MSNHAIHQSRWSMFSLLLVVVFALAFVTACGSSDDAETPAASGATATPPAATTPATGMTPGTGAAPGSPADQLGEIGACFEENTTPQMVEDLRAGETATAEEVYRTCLGEMLPESLVAQLEPVIEDAAACGVTASEQLSDQDMAALESGDRAVAERVSLDTLNCLSEELGVPLS